MMTIHDIAGFCPEEAVWKLLADVSECLLNDGVGNGLSPDTVTIDGNTFMVNGTEEAENTFQAPEHKDGQPSDEKENVWSLGATAYYAATGHVVFGGHGGSYQKEHPLVTLPALPKGMQALTPLMQRCLCYLGDISIGIQSNCEDRPLFDLIESDSIEDRFINCIGRGLVGCREQIGKIHLTSPLSFRHRRRCLAVACRGLTVYCRALIAL